MAKYDNIYTQLEEDYGLERLLEQNDIEPWQVVEMLHQRGLLDLDDYWFSVVDTDEED